MTVLLSPLAVLLAAVVVFCVLLLISRGRRIMLGTCAALFVVSFVLGLTLYTVSYMTPGSGVPGLLRAALHGLLSTGRMFFSEYDFDFARDPSYTPLIVNSVWLQILFWLAHVMALVVSAAALMSVFGRRAMSRLRLMFGRCDAAYIVVGSGRAAMTLAENLATHDGTQKPDTRRRVVLLTDAPSDEDSEAASAFSGIVLEYDDKSFCAALKTAGLGARGKRDVDYKVILLPQESGGAVALMERLMVYAEAQTVGAERLEIYLLSESEWSRGAAQERAREHGYVVHIASEANLSARQMIAARPPYRELAFTGGVANKNFTALILGFGETGQQALLRLIMNGQFQGSRMRAVVVDANAEKLAGRFLHRYPALGLCCDTAFHTMDVRSAEFFKLLDTVCAQTDYIVVSLGDDGENLQLMLDIQSKYADTGAKTPALAVAVTDKLQSVSEAGGALFFSGRAELYRESIVIRADADKMAMAVNTVYTGDGDRSDVSPADAWRKLDFFTQESNRAAADYVDTMLHLAQITAEEAVTKSNLTDDDALSDTLARTEHLRWMAFHAAMGWSALGTDEMRERHIRKDGALKRHLCLVPWEDLARISGEYNEMTKALGNGENPRDFEEDDRHVVQNVPKFLRQRAKSAD
jgi:hypothetical protein